MGQGDTWPNTGLRIAIALAAGFVLCAAGPHSARARSVSRRPADHGATADRGSWAGCRSRSPAGRARRASSPGTARQASWSSSRPVTAWRAAGCRRYGRIMARRSASLGRGLRPGLERRRRCASTSRTHMRAMRSMARASTDIRSVTDLGAERLAVCRVGVCRSGGTSGWRCGSIIAADVDATVGGMVIHHTWWTDFPSAAGDSGSPVLDHDGRAAGS